ncbi:MAG TPA: phage tail tip lysozyme [Candidatus Saccharimonadales bacterium]|nr:phage tail tip lysozyme [Candidatus Saccharimonadales bacterium]
MIHISAIKVRRFLGLAFSVMAVLILVGQSSVYALTTEQQKAFQKNILYFNTEYCISGDTTVGADVNLTGSDNAEKAFNFFVQKGLTAQQAAGILGNLWAESGINPKRQQGNGGPAYGIAQWENPRLSAMRSWVTQHGGDPDSMAGQLSWYWNELQTTEKSAGDKIKTADSVTTATVDIWVYFERAALAQQYQQGSRSQKVMEELSRRVGAAQKYLQLYGGTAAASDGTAGDNTTSDSSDDNPTDTGVSCANGGTTDIGTGKGKFTDNTTKTYPGVDAMLARAKAVSDLQGSYFRQICGVNGSSNCYRMCSYLMARIWGKGSSGKSYAVGSNAGNGLWYYLLSTGHGHANDRSVPVGALLFYKTGSIAGHVAIYLGNNKVLSNDVLDSTSHVTGGAYITDASAMESGPWRLTYLGWADPAYPT